MKIIKKQHISKRIIDAIDEYKKNSLAPIDYIELTKEEYKELEEYSNENFYSMLKNQEVVNSGHKYITTFCGYEIRVKE